MHQILSTSPKRRGSTGSQLSGLGLRCLKPLSETEPISNLTGNQFSEFRQVDIAARNDADNRAIANLTGERCRQ